MVRILVATVLAVAMGAAAAWLILTNAYPHEGPWITVTPRHGIHAGDVVIVLIWLLVVSGLAVWVRRAVRGGRA